MNVQFANYEWSLESTSDLLAAMNQSLEQVAYHGGEPLVMTGRDVSTPAWEFVGTLARKNPQWAGACGIALQHAVTDGGDTCRVAFADLVTNYRESFLLSDWTVPLAALHPDIHATRSNMGLGGGHNRPRLADVIADQQALVPVLSSPDRQVVLAGNTTVQLRNQAQLAALLLSTAAAAKPVLSSWGDGPWGWLHEEIVFRPWVANALPGVLETLFQQGDLGVVHATLDWLSDGCLLGAMAPLLESTAATPPLWAADKAKQKAPKWKRPIRPARWHDIDSLLDVVMRLRTAARAAKIAPRLDHQQLYGN